MASVPRRPALAPLIVLLACPLFAQQLPPGGQFQVGRVDSQYPVAPGSLSGWFRAGQSADIVLSSFGFNRSGGALQFHHPRSLAGDATRLLLADSNNNRVLVWTSLPDANTPPDLVLGQPDFQSNYAGSGPDGMSWPGQVALAPDGRVVVADSYNDRLLIWKSFPRASGQPADLTLRTPALRWPWGVWTDGVRLVATSTGGRSILFWNRFPDSPNQAPDFEFKDDAVGTPRTVTSDGRRLIVGDHNAYGDRSGNFFWKTFPRGPQDRYDFFARDPVDGANWMQGAFAPDGRLLMLGRTLHIWNTFPESETARPNLSITGYQFFGGDGGAVVVAGERLYLPEYNGNRIVAYRRFPDRPEQRPDFAIGSPDFETNTLRREFLITNPVPVTDGQSLFVSSDFDRRLCVWTRLPAASAAKSNWAYELPFAPWDNALHGGRLVLAGKDTVAIWNQAPLGGEMPSTVLRGSIGSVRFAEIRGVALDDRYFYLSDFLADKVYVWRGVPSANSEPAFTFTIRQPARLSSDGTTFVVTSTENHTLHTFKVADLGPSSQPRTVGAPGVFNLPQGARLYQGQLIVANTTANRVHLWRDVDTAIAQRPADVILGSADAQPRNGADGLFWPGVPAFDGSYLWVGEFKFSGRMPRFSVQPAAAADAISVVNAATYATAVAPGSLITIFGAGLQGAAVEVNGRQAPVLYSGATQINAQLPFETAPGPATLRAGNATVTIQVSAAAPGIFKVAGDRAAAQAVRPGEYATIYLTGQGAVSPAVGTGQSAPASPLSRAVLPVAVTVGGIGAEVQFAGLAPGYVGLMQLNLRVPQLAPGDHPVVVTIGGASSNSALLPVAGTAASSSWNAGVRVARTGSFPHGGRTYQSSSSLRVTWTAPAAAVHHYTVEAAERRSRVRVDAPAAAVEATVTGLKAGTNYTVRVLACPDPACAAPLASDPATGATEEEYWVVQGRGNSYATADRLVPDGNVGSYAFRYGAWAGPELDGRIQLYYTPLQANEKGIKIGEMIAPRADSLAAASSFRGVSGFGLLRVCQPVPGSPGGQPQPPADPGCTNRANLAVNLNLFQAVPLAAPAGPKVRLFFEAGGGDGRTRILWLDSQDGYVGRDFHAGAATRCNTLDDYAPGGGCEPKLAIGVDLDGVAGNPNLLNARQFKILYPTLDSWVWDMSPGTPMWFTTEWPNGRCSPYGFNAAYAVWTGARWSVAYQPDGCPKLLAGAQAPAPVHLGGARYKLYFNLHPRPGGPTDPQQALKPMRMLYADPEATGDPALVEFEDWEPLASARTVRYLWPDGGALTEEEVSRLDDYVIFAPTPDPTRLIMYSNMSAGGAQGLPFIGSAVLLN
jgi:uncharacterized protein (TIGR03437 family)